MTPVIPARPTTYKGIRMRSRLEASFAQFLDAITGQWEYEPMCFASEAGQYLPDFLVRRSGLNCRTRERRHQPLCATYVEVKPCLDAALGTMRRMEIIHASEPGAALLVWLDDFEDGALWLPGRSWMPWHLETCDTCGFFYMEFDSVEHGPLPACNLPVAP